MILWLLQVISAAAKTAETEIVINKRQEILSALAEIVVAKSSESGKEAAIKNIDEAIVAIKSISTSE